MIGAVTRWLQGLGAFGVACLALLASSAAAYVGLVVPLQQTSQRMHEQLDTAAQDSTRREFQRASNAPQAQLAAFYAFFDRPESIDVWLAKIHGIASASGLDWRAADYQLAEPRHRLERYRISLPVGGTYAQVRTFLERTLLEVPVASLDHITYRRKETSDLRVEAEIVLTLHLFAQ